MSWFKKIPITNDLQHKIEPLKLNQQKKIIRYNLILIIDKGIKNVLMCIRKKEPYIGMYNLVGGKLEANENSLDGAYRELAEETGIKKEDTKLHHVMNLTFISNEEETILECFAGKLNKEVNLIEEINKLVWLDLEITDFANNEKFAGQGNLFYLIKFVIGNKDKILIN